MDAIPARSRRPLQLLIDRGDTLRQSGNAAAFRAMPAAVAGLFGVIGVERVDFISVPTRDLARARRFYGEVLGLRRSHVNPDEFEAANVTLTLWQPEAQDVPFSPNTAGIALRVADVNVAREQLVANGVEFLGDTVDTGVCLMGFFYDPDGNVLILHRRYAPLGD